MSSNKQAEQIRDKFKQDCKNCFDLAEKEIQTLFDKIGFENRCNQGYLYEQLRNTENRNKYFKEFFMSGPSALVSSSGIGSSYFYQCTLYSQEFGMKLNRLADELLSSIECDGA